MKNVLSILAAVVSFFLLVDSLYRFLVRNTKRYIEDDSYFSE